MNQSELMEKMKALETQYTQEQLTGFAEKFSRDGILIISDIIPEAVHAEIKNEVIRLLDECRERVDIKLATTDNSPRKMNIVSHRSMLEKADFIKRVYENESLKTVLQTITRDKMINYISDDEGLFVSRQENPGDTHGWHWGDYSFALIYILETPPIELGGMLQCVPHTSWNKSNPRIHKYLCENPITTYGFKSGDIYLLKTDTTLHRTIPLNAAATRIMLNMTWGTEADKERHANTTEDTWWQNQEVEAAVPLNA